MHSQSIHEYAYIQNMQSHANEEYAYLQNMHSHRAPKYAYFYAYPMHIVELQFGTHKPLEGYGRKMNTCYHKRLEWAMKAMGLFNMPSGRSHPPISDKTLDADLDLKYKMIS
jgi:hypothetical protein